MAESGVMGEISADEVSTDKEKQIRQHATDVRMRRITELNEKYEVNDYHGEVGEGHNYQIILGKVPVLLSAPHAVCQMRDGKVKDRDGMTGGITEYLCEQLGTFGTVRLWNANDDPNYADDEQSMQYRETVVNLVREYNIKWLFDIHACLNKHGFEMDVGINGGKNLACSVEEIRELVQKCWLDLDVRIDEKFTAGHKNGVSNYVHQATGINCVQLELSGKIRTTEEGFERFYQGLKNVIY